MSDTFFEVKELSDGQRAYFAWLNAHYITDEQAERYKAELARLTNERWYLQAENDRLRELVRDMMRFMEGGSEYCDSCPLVTSCDDGAYGDDCRMRGVFERRMAELGVEVDE